MICWNKVHVGYKNHMVLKNITTTFAEPSFVCLVGPNGSGKSTLLRAMAGLQPYTGTILLDGKELSHIPRTERACKIAYLPQQCPIPSIDVATLIAHGRFPHLGFSKTLSASDRQIVEEAAAKTGAASLLTRDLTTLSGGERQRAYLAMVIAQNAQVILLDEPATFLDIRYQLELMEVLCSLHRSGKTILMAAHDLPQAFSVATDVKVLQDGVILVEGAPDALCGNALLEQAFAIGIEKQPDPSALYPYRAIVPK